MKGFITIFFLWVICSNTWFNGAEDIMAPMEKTEKEALYNAIQGFVGKRWNGSDLYPDPCGWTPIQGVSCDLSDGLWYVTALNIGPAQDNSLGCDSNSKFRPHLFRLKHLKRLSFFNCFKNPITVPLDGWDNFGGTLESLELRSNPGLIGEIPSSFGNLKHLQSLVLLENRQTGGLPENIGNLKKLRRLVLSGNRFTGRIPVSIGGLSQLLILDLSRNFLSGPLPRTLGGLTSLLKLDLSNNQLEGKLPKEIGDLKNLTLLDFRKNRFSGGLIQPLEEMDSLEEMVLSNNLMGGDLMSLRWEKLRNLVILDLSKTRLHGEIPDSLGELKRVRFLGLNDNNLTGNVPPKLADLPCVGALYLNGNNFSGELMFSDLFYGKMGRRFGAWDNPNLCYSVGVMATDHAPIGVKPCQRETMF